MLSVGLHDRTETPSSGACASFELNERYVISLTSTSYRTGASMEIGSVLSSQESRFAALQNTVNSIQSVVTSLQGQVDAASANCSEGTA